MATFNLRKHNSSQRLAQIRDYWDGLTENEKEKLTNELRIEVKNRVLNLLEEQGYPGSILDKGWGICNVNS